MARKRKLGSEDQAGERPGDLVIGSPLKGFASSLTGVGDKLMKEPIAGSVAALGKGILDQPWKGWGPVISGSYASSARTAQLATELLRDPEVETLEATREVRREVAGVATVLSESGKQLGYLAEIAARSEAETRELRATIADGQQASERLTWALVLLTVALVLLTAFLALDALGVLEPAQP